MMGFGRYGYGFLQGMPWYGWIGPVIMVIFWALLITAIILSIRHFVRRSRHDAPALEILKARYAKGEISKEEFEEKKKDIL